MPEAARLAAGPLKVVVIGPISGHFGLSAENPWRFLFHANTKIIIDDNIFFFLEFQNKEELHENPGVY